MTLKRLLILAKNKKNPRFFTIFFSMLRAIAFTQLALFFFVSNSLASTACLSSKEKSECVLAADFGLRAETIVVESHPQDSDIIMKEPKTNQIVKWVDSYLFTDGLKRDKGDESSKAGVLTGYVSGGWNPWGYKQYNTQCCVVNDCDQNLSLLKPGELCLGIGTPDKIGKMVDDDIDKDRIPCVLKDGYGLYGLLALEKDGKFADPNDKENLDLNPEYFRTFRLGKLYDVSAGKTSNTMKRFEVKYTQQWDKASKTWKIDEKDGVPYIPRGKIYFKVYDNYYQDNYGKYEIYIDGGVVKKQGFIEDIIYTIKSTSQKVTSGIYKAIVHNYGFLNIVRVILVLYIVFTGVMFSLGMIKMHQSELVIRVFKIAIIISLISETSWGFLYNYISDFFYQAPVAIADKIMSLSMFDQDGNPLMRIYDDDGHPLTTNNSTAFSVYDSVLQMLGKWQLHFKILALFYHWHFYMIPVIYIAIAFMLIGMLKAMVQYLSALFMIFLLITTAPIFIIMILFKVTNELFENWIKYLVSNGLMMIVTMATVALLLSLMLESLITFLSFNICKEVIFDFAPLGFTIFKIYWWLPPNDMQFAQAVTLGNFLKLIISAVVFSVYMDHVPKLVDALSNMARAPMSGIYSAAMGAFYQSAVYDFMMNLSAMNPIGARIDRRMNDIMERSGKEGASTRDKIMGGMLNFMSKASNADLYLKYKLSQFGGDQNKSEAANLRQQMINKGFLEKPDSQKTLKELFAERAEQFSLKEKEKELTTEEKMQNTKLGGVSLEKATKGHDPDKKLSLKLSQDDLAKLTLDGQSAKDLIKNLAKGDDRIDFDKGVPVKLGEENISKLFDDARTLRGGSGKVSVVIHPPATSMRDVLNDYQREKYDNVMVGDKSLSDVLQGLKADAFGGLSDKQLERQDSIASSIRIGEQNLLAHIQESRDGEALHLSSDDIEIQGRSLSELMQDSEVQRNSQEEIVLEIEPAHALEPETYESIDIGDTNMSDILSSLTKEDLSAVDDPAAEITVKGMSLGDIIKKKEDSDGAFTIPDATMKDVRVKDKDLSKILSGEAIERRGGAK